MEQNDVIAPASPKQELMLNQECDFAILGGAAGCLDGSAEFLTETGWKKISEYTYGDKVLQYSPVTKVANWVQPLEYIKKPNKTFKRLRARGLDFILSDEHKILYYNDGSSNYKTLPYSEVLARHEKSKTKGWTGKIPTTFEVSSKGIPLTEGEIRLQVAVQADGRIVKGGADNYTSMRFSKKRKYERLLKLCKEFSLRHIDKGSRYDPKYSNETEYEVIVYPKLATKVFNDFWWSCSNEQLSWIVDEVGHWDGSIIKNNKSNTIRYYTSIKENADFLQYAFHSQGYNTSLVVGRGDEYTVNATLTGKGFRRFANKDGKTKIEDFESTDGYKYCFTTESGFFVVRQNGKIFITGNSGKSFVLLLYPLKFSEDPYFRGIIFRKTTGEITGQGGLWETAVELYSNVFDGDIKINKTEMRITFPSGGSIKFSHMEKSGDRFRHQGNQYSFIGFDEGTHFGKEEITYLGTRLRSARAKHKMQMVITCNPDPDWDYIDFVKPYLDDEGTPRAEMDGVVRYYTVVQDEFKLSDNREDLEKLRGATGEGSGVRSYTFISATCEDNPPLLKNNPEYVGELRSKPYIDMMRLLYGNWYVRPTGSTYFERDWCEEVDYVNEEDVVSTVRCHDFAGTLKSDINPNPDYTTSVRMRLMRDGTYIIDDIRRHRIRHGDWFDWVLKCSYNDPHNTVYYIPEDPNPAAKKASMMFARQLSEAGLFVRRLRTNRSKLDRFRPFSSMAQNGGVKFLSNCATCEENNIVNDLSFVYAELEIFTGERNRSRHGHDDVVDAISDCFSVLATSNTSLSGINKGLHNMGKELATGNMFNF